MNSYLKILFITIISIYTGQLTAQKLSMEYSTLLGGSSDDRAHGMAVDKQGNIYLTAPIQSINFPVTPGALNSTPTGIYLAKINPAGDSLIFSTYIGASGGANYAHGVAVDDEGNIYITGNTTNSNFPTTGNAFDRTFNGPSNSSHGDAFVMKLNPEGNKIIYSTFIGGTGMDLCGKIAIDAEGCAYIIGSTSSSDFPVTAGAFDTTFNGGRNDARDDIFVAKVNPSGSQLIYCTYIGGPDTDVYGNNIVIDNSGAVYFTATTVSDNFPTTPDAYDNSFNGGSGERGAGDGVIVKLNPDGTALEYSTFFGGSGDDFTYWLDLNEKGNVYICGGTASTDIPLTSDAYNKNINGGYIAEFSPDLKKLLYSTYWNASVQIIDLDTNGNIIISGSTETKDFPVTPDALETIAKGSNDIYISILNPVSNNLIYSAYFGGKDNDILSSLLIDENSIYICGNTVSSDFPTSESAYDKTFNGGTNQWGGDAFVAKFVNLNTQTPSLIYSTLIGGNGYDYGHAITVDDSGCAYIAGQANSSDYPTTPYAFDNTFNGSSDILLSKINKNGSALMYSTYIGGSGRDNTHNVFADKSGYVYLTGSTSSTDFPLTNSSLTGSHEGYILKISATGDSLLYSSWLAGGEKLLLDSKGNLVITGTTSFPDFPTTECAFSRKHRGDQDIFVAKVNLTTNTIIFSTLVGGNGKESSLRMTIDGKDNIIIAGQTASEDFPLKGNRFSDYIESKPNLFLLKLKSDGSDILFSTIIGGNGNDYPTDMAVDLNNDIYVTGMTKSVDFPVSPSAFDTSHNSGDDAFLFKMSSDGDSILYSTYIGGSDKDWGRGIVVDKNGRAYLTGCTRSTDFPVSENAYDKTFNGAGTESWAWGDPFLLVMNAEGNNLEYSSYFGGSSDEEAYGIAMDSKGDIYICGITSSDNFPTTEGSYDRTKNGSTNIYAAKFQFRHPEDIKNVLNY